MRNGYRVGAYLVLVDTEGLRHAVRVNAILSVSDADMCQDTAVVVAAGRQIIVPSSWETVMGWIEGTGDSEEIVGPEAESSGKPAPPPQPRPQGLPDSVLDIDAVALEAAE
jgi:hypothetical protein